MKLLDGRGAEGVAGGEHDRAAFVAELLSQLADGGGLARAVDADHQDDEGFLGGVDHERTRDGAECLFDLGREDGADFVA